MVKTIQAMQVVDKIKEVRKERFHKKRLAEQLRKRRTAAQREVVKSAHLLEGPNKLKPAAYEKELGPATKKKTKTKVRMERAAAGSSMEVEQ